MSRVHSLWFVAFAGACFPNTDAASAADSGPVEARVSGDDAGDAGGPFDAAEPGDAGTQCEDLDAGAPSISDSALWPDPSCWEPVGWLHRSPQVCVEDCEPVDHDLASLCLQDPESPVLGVRRITGACESDGGSAGSYCGTPELVDAGYLVEICDSLSSQGWTMVLDKVVECSGTTEVRFHVAEIACGHSLLPEGWCLRLALPAGTAPVVAVHGGTELREDCD